MIEEPYATVSISLMWLWSCRGAWGRNGQESECPAPFHISQRAAKVTCSWEDRKQEAEMYRKNLQGVLSLIGDNPEDPRFPLFPQTIWCEKRYRFLSLGNSPVARPHRFKGIFPGSSSLPKALWTRDAPEGLWLLVFLPFPVGFESTLPDSQPLWEPSQPALWCKHNLNYLPQMEQHQANKSVKLPGRWMLVLCVH